MIQSVLRHCFIGTINDTVNSNNQTRLFTSFRVVHKTVLTIVSSIFFASKGDLQKQQLLALTLTILRKLLILQACSEFRK